MGKKRKAAPPPPKVELEKRKPKVVVEDDPSEEEEEQDSEPEEVEEEEEESEEEEEEEEEEESEEEENEEDEDGSERQSLRKLLKPFGKDQIIELLVEAALNERSIISRINQLAESGTLHRNLFVFGLGWDATTEQVLSVFKEYGEIEDCKVVTDKLTGRAKGYAFVLFKTRGSAHKALKQPHKMIGNRMTSCQLASAGPVPNQMGSLQDSNDGRKIYVGNVGPLVSPDKLLSFFAKFGDIEEGPLGLDRVTGKFKGFAIFVYKTVEACMKALEEPVKVFEGCQLQCRLKGLQTKKNQKGALGASSGAAAITQTDINTLKYGVAVNPGILNHNVNPAILNHNVNPAILNHNVNPAAVLMGQSQGIGLVNQVSPGIGLANPMMASAFNHTGLALLCCQWIASVDWGDPINGIQWELWYQ
ncbi:hypothetical protein F0562_016600 [Nyssa sinensis]|uniref:RRM domain-containing protein n=1 Tax=Nyssa sinensis TaxID=561372 RepID=A0A5J4ZGE3_9ASTE|nr:hypothetical protein F0562_016600 [Nyssa sinensis]